MVKKTAKAYALPQKRINDLKTIICKYAILRLINIKIQNEIITENVYVNGLKCLRNFVVRNVRCLSNVYL